MPDRDGIRRYTSVDHRICSNYGVSSDHKVVLFADNRCARANPTAFLNMDSATFRYPLFTDGERYILVSVVVISNKY